MLRVRPLLRIESPDATTCHECGEGTLAFGIVQQATSSPEYAIHCDACPFVAAL